MKATMRNSRNGSAKHNDRDFDLNHELNDGHIDVDRQHLNEYWNCYQNNEMTFYEAEKQFYKDNYTKTVQRTNERAKAVRHKERMTTINRMYTNQKTQPEETILQIGDRNQSVDLETFTACVKDYIAELEKHSEHIHILDWAIHGDEETPHAHIRKVYDYVDEEGIKRISARKALALEGFEREDLTKPESILNNSKITFDKHMREKWYDICEARQIEIDRTPEETVAHVDKEEYIRQQQEAQQKLLEQTMAEVARKQAELQELEQRTLMLDTEYQETKEKHKKLKEMIKEDIKEYKHTVGRKHANKQLEEHDIIKSKERQKLL